MRFCEINYLKETEGTNLPWGCNGAYKFFVGQ